MADIITHDIPKELGKRHPYDQVSVGNCQDISKTYSSYDNAQANKSLGKCAAFRMNAEDTLMIGSEGITKGVILNESELRKSNANIGTSVSGISKGLDMMNK
ncbi:MAG: hypothetical protein RBR86_00335 [Pseudobdellovibrionaceae bacterium]|jgi:hypothetical protein|nr:hypothetical protein [Pseudobdellovibrionaceae bacterium]